MCYSLSQLKFKAYKTAKHDGASDDELTELYDAYLHQLIEESKESDIQDYRYYHTNGFDHEPLTVISNSDEVLEEMNWGLIPHWTKKDEDANAIQNKTINARAETLFEKPAFKSAQNNRCLIVIPSFFEYHLKAGKKVPHRIKRKDGLPMIVAGIWDEYQDDFGNKRRTCSVVTTKANQLLTEIHNNGKEPRMPLILEDDLATKWLRKLTPKFNLDSLGKLVAPYPDGKLEAYPVRQLVGKNGVGNKPQAIEEWNEEDWLLF